jgi:hypothetical protein
MTEERAWFWWTIAFLAAMVFSAAILGLLWTAEGWPNWTIVPPSLAVGAIIGHVAMKHW